MPKQCIEPNCSNDQFGGGYCVFHQYKRDKYSKAKREAKYTKVLRKSFKKAKIKPRSNKKSKHSFGFKNQVELFDYIWRTQPHVCWLTGRPLKYNKGDNKWVNQFAHVLRKGTYTYFKLNPENIRLLDPIIHDLVDNFKESYREQLPHINFNKWFLLQREMKDKYEQYKNDNLLS